PTLPRSVPITPDWPSGTATGVTGPRPEPVMVIISPGAMGPPTLLAALANPAIEGTGTSCAFAVCTARVSAKQRDRTAAVRFIPSRPDWAHRWSRNRRPLL